jgi:hypothetical protein
VRLLPPEAFAAVFAPFAGRRVGLVTPRGNTGDTMIHAATVQLLDHFGVAWTRFDPDAPEDVDELAFGGGGNMGDLHPGNAALRARCMTLGLPMTILPQSFVSRDDLGWKRVWVRERISLRHCRRASLAPDLALGFDYTARAAVEQPTGVFLRADVESAVRRPAGARDPVAECATPAEYVELAARHGHVVTDRLHFAIAGLIAGRQVTLLPNSYHKNRGMYDAWLADLGSHWAGGVRRALSAARRRAARTGSGSWSAGA